MIAANPNLSLTSRFTASRTDIAPEVQEGERYGSPADVYSFAITVLALVDIDKKPIEHFRDAIRAKRRAELAARGITRNKSIKAKTS